MKALRALVIATSMMAAVAPTTLSANELNNSIQAFHRGDYESAFQSLGQLITDGNQDARVYYYRGLIHLRHRHHKAAARDFEAAMQLEASGHGQGVSAALERVQGNERLVIEKYRNLARLASRSRRQAPAPPPNVFDNNESVQDASVTLPAGQPLFRLASEIPMRAAPPPVIKSPARSLVTDQPPEQPLTLPSSEAEAANAPVGTGVVDADDPFAEFATPGAEFAEPTSSDPPSRTQSVLQGVIRALFRANVPQVSLPSMMPPGVPGTAPADFGGPDDGPGFGDDDFGFDEDSTDEDPFGDF